MVIAFVVVAAATLTLLPISNAPAEDTAGFVVHIDPVTGKPTAPAPGVFPVMLDAKTRYAFSTSFEGLERQSSTVPGGGFFVDLEGRFQHGYVAAGDNLGAVKVPCISGIPHDEDYVWTPPSIDEGGSAVKSAYPPRKAASSGATIIIQNNDDPGEGFNDPTAWTPTGGNPATTLGEARLNCFQYAADIWGSLLNSDVLIIVRAAMDELDCAPLYGVLGSAGAVTISANFAGAPQTDTYYPAALANSLAGQDLIPAHPDISATFNSLLNGDPGCLLGAGWYYGFDANPGTNEIDFVSVLLHEFGHGLGFISYVNLYTGGKPDGLDDTYSNFLDRAGANPSDYPSMTNTQRRDASISDPDLRWVGPNVSLSVPLIPLIGGTNGGKVRIHAPDPLQPGSSVSHWAGGVLPNEALEPVYTVPIHDPSLALWLMKDIGWGVDSVPQIPDPAAQIASIDDVPNDQGGLVDVTISADEDLAIDDEVTGYNIYRRVDGGTLAAGGMEASEASVVGDHQSIKTPSGKDAWPLPNTKVVSRGDDFYVVGSPGLSSAASFPPGTWKVVATVFATQSDSYIVEATTGGDFPIYSTYVVTTHTTTPSLWFISDPDSGYSIDNIVPGVPAAFSVVYNSDNNYLSWQQNTEQDFQYYRVYRSTDASFTPDPSNLVQATDDLTWIDGVANPSAQFYKMTAVDDAGNESDPASPSTATSTQDPVIPNTFVLHQNVPNPFNPATTIHYDVARGGGAVTLRIFDAKGRLVKTLIDGVQSEGQKSVAWSGLNDGGQQVATGVYFYRLTAQGFSQTRRMVLLK